jgi:hypothetical protein
MRKYLQTISMAIAILCASSAAHAQGGNVGSTSSPTANNLGRPIPGVNIAICQPLATTAASVTSNLAVLTMASNPQTAGFAAGMQIQVAGFTGGDTIFNGGSIVNGQITGGFIISSVTPTTITFALVHANQVASTNGTVLQEGNAATPCGGLSSIFSDPALTQSASQPLLSDALGNWNAFAAPGVYYLQFYGSGVTTVVKQVAIACVPLNASTGCGGTFSGTVAAGQIVYGAAPNQFASSPNALWNQAGQQMTLFSTTPATGGANSNSPTFGLTGNYWTGAASAADNWTFQIVEGTGSNPVSTYVVTGGNSPGGQLFHIKTAFTVDLAVNFAQTLAMQGTIFTAAVNTAIAYQNKGNTPATSSVSTSSGEHQFVGEYWTGAASADDIWQFQNVVGNGTNGSSTATWTHSGSPGPVIWSAPGIFFSCGTITAGGACAPTTSGNGHCFSGIATLSGGTSTITAISPAFTSSTSYNVVTNDLTTIANPSKGVPASGSSITFTGTGTDNLSFIACGE